MSNRQNGISHEQFTQLNSLLNLSLNPETEDSQERCGRVISMDEFRKKSQAEELERSKASERTDQLLKVLKGICRDYEAHMLTIANQRPRKQWQEETGTDPYGQIQYDMDRLGNLIQALEFALEKKNACTLAEALEEVYGWGQEELTATIDYIFESDYFGFQAMARLFGVGEMEGGNYSENDALLSEIQEDLVDGEYVFSIEPITNLKVAEELVG